MNDVLKFFVGTIAGTCTRMDIGRTALAGRAALAGAAFLSSIPFALRQA